MLKKMAILVPLLLVAGCRATATSSEPVLLHHVYFDLVEDDAAACEAFAHEFGAALSLAPGMSSMIVTPRAVEFQRDVNDQEFDVALAVTFASRAAHDMYQVSPEHIAAGELLKSRIARVRVFDAWTLR